MVLSSSSGTGYSWQLDQAPAVLTQLRPPEYLPSNSRLPGGPEERVFHYQAATKGSGKLSFKLVRSFEPKKAPAETFAITAVVKPK